MTTQDEQHRCTEKEFYNDNMNNSHPTSMMIIEKPFSLLVLGLERRDFNKREIVSIEIYISNLTLPKPTDVKDEKVK